MQRIFNESMKNHTTFRAGGPVREFVLVNNIKELKETLEELQYKDYMILGNGSNVLFSDSGLNITVIKLQGDFSTININENIVTSGAGVLLSQTAMKAYESGLAGMEFAAGIPGTIGGAMVMNAGAYGGEMKDIVQSVEAMDENGEIISLGVDELELGYRTSIFKHRKMVVLNVTLKLAYGDKVNIKETMDELAAKRREKQPLEYPSAGSTFKRPEGYFAGKLIEDAGLKGFSVGGAQVSTKHSGFIINKSGATATDIYQLIKEVQNRVYQDSKVWLEPEVILLGEF